MSDTVSTMQDDPAFEDWSGEMGERWLAYLDQFEGMIRDYEQRVKKQTPFDDDIKTGLVIVNMMDAGAFQKPL